MLISQVKHFMKRIYISCYFLMVGTGSELYFLVGTLERNEKNRVSARNGTIGK